VLAAEQPRRRGLVGRAFVPIWSVKDTAMGRFLVIVGLAIVLIGLLWPWLSRLGLGCLPGDIHIQGERGSLFIPITTSVLVSIALSVLLWLFSR
jgi:Protein of unknown function (DUF2905)